MATYPTANVHRSSRRKLGRGQYPAAPGIACTLTAAGDVATMTFATPVIVSGVIPLQISGGPTYVSQAIVSPTVVTQTFSASVAASPYVLPSNAANVSNAQGGRTIGESGTF